MALAIVRLGTPRLPDEGLRIGTVRRPPRGVPKTEFASQDWYDVWFPNLAPSNDTMKLGQGAETPAQWSAFCKQYKAELATPSGRQARSGAAGRPLPHHQPVGGLLLRTGVPLSSRHLARATDRRRRRHAHRVAALTPDRKGHLSMPFCFAAALAGLYRTS